ncbi:MAG TPA: hypothetical protein VK163_05525 [Opitutaceae bacterium]|nr:hypothetical protein [Opitutaceae bacterium]
MNTNTNTTGQIKRLVLDIDGQKYALDPSITKEEALSLVDILSKGVRRYNSTYSQVTYREFYFAEGDVDVCLRVTSADLYESRAAAQQAADAATAEAKEVAK